MRIMLVMAWAWGICLIHMLGAADLRVEGIHIGQITNAHVTSVMYHFVPIVTTPVV